MITLYDAAGIAHEAHRRLRSAHGMNPIPAWDDPQLPIHMRDACLTNARFRLKHGPLYEGEAHAYWVQKMIDAGWTKGERTDADAKTHANLVPFAQLPPFSQKADRLFSAICEALKPDVR